MTRRALLKRLPALTAVYGLRPWELEKMTLDELRTYLRALPSNDPGEETADG